MKLMPKLLLVMVALVLIAGLTGPVFAGDYTKGKVTKVEPERMQFVIADKDGKNTTFSMDEDAPVYINDHEAQLADLRAGDDVTIRARQDGTDWMAVEVRCVRN